MIRALICVWLAMLSAGCSLPSTADSIQAAVQSNDAGAITRAFHEAIYDRSAKMDEALPAVRRFLKDPSPFVRVRAAETLYTAGDRSGYSALIDLVRSAQPQMDGDYDLRFKAGTILAKFRETQAAADVFDLYRRTNGGGLLEASVKLGATDAVTVMAKYGYVQNEFSIERYARLCPPEFLPKLVATFSTATEPAMRTAVAYALVRLTGEQSYVEYLAQAAQPAIDAKPHSGAFSYDDSSKALKYLGSIRGQRAREVLERALDSANGVAIHYAVVNLLFNQPGGSAKARLIVLRQLDGVPLILDSWERTFQIAATLNDPEIRAAAEAFDRRTGDRSWHYWGVERKNWPIYNWIDDYVEDFRGNGA
jgi:HEAT repeat protein